MKKNSIILRFLISFNISAQDLNVSYDLSKWQAPYYLPTPKTGQLRDSLYQLALQKTFHIKVLKILDLQSVLLNWSEAKRCAKPKSHMLCLIFSRHFA